MLVFLTPEFKNQIASVGWQDMGAEFEGQGHKFYGRFVTRIKTENVRCSVCSFCGHIQSHGLEERT